MARWVGGPSREDSVIRGLLDDLVAVNTCWGARRSHFPSACHLPCAFPGCSGALAKECTSLYPACRVAVFDTPEVVQTAEKHFSFPEAARISFCAGGLRRALRVHTETHVCSPLGESSWRAPDPGTPDLASGGRHRASCRGRSHLFMCFIQRWKE